MSHNILEEQAPDRRSSAAVNNSGSAARADIVAARNDVPPAGRKPGRRPIKRWPRGVAAAGLGLSFSLSLLACGDVEDDNATGGASASSSVTGSGGGSEASGGGGASSGSAASGGSGGGSVALDLRIEACLRVNACEADGGTPMGLQTCLAYELDQAWAWATVGPASLDLAIMECKLKATDCAAVRACTPAVDTFAAACSDHAGSSLCQGDTAVYCDDLGAPQVAMNCAAAGLSCTSSDFAAGCGAEPCDPRTTAAMCDPADKDVLLVCNNAGSLTRVQCPTQYSVVHVHTTAGDKVFSIAGETCGFDEQRNGFGCIGTGAPCDFFSQRCDGSVLETCAGGQLARRDCTAVEPAGQGCGFIQSGQFGGAASCGLVASACDVGIDSEACDGGVLRFCSWGTPAELDCRTAGYAGCAVAERGGRTVGYCTP